MQRCFVMDRGECLFGIWGVVMGLILMGFDLVLMLLLLSPFNLFKDKNWY